MQGVEHLTILVVVTWRHVNAALDGQERADADPGGIIQEWHFFVYDGLKRPAGWAPVQHALELLANQYKAAGIKHLDLWSDGCAAQFKSRTPFLGFTYLQERFSRQSLSLTWEYYGSQRGKCVPDLRCGAASALG